MPFLKATSTIPLLTRGISAEDKPYKVAADLKTKTVIFPMCGCKYHSLKIIMFPSLATEIVSYIHVPLVRVL